MKVQCANMIKLQEDTIRLISLVVAKLCPILQLSKQSVLCLQFRDHRVQRSIPLNILESH